MARDPSRWLCAELRVLRKRVSDMENANRRRILRLDELLLILPFASIPADNSPLIPDAAEFAPATMTDCNFALLLIDFYFDDNDVDDDGEQYKYDDVDIRAVVDLPAASVVPHDAHHTSVDAAFHDASSKNTKQVHFHDDTAETVPPTQFPAEYSDDVQSFNNFLQFDTDDFKSTMTTVATQAFKPLQEELLEELRGFREELEELEHMKVETREDVDEEWIPNDDDIDEDAYEDKDDDDIDEDAYEDKDEDHSDSDSLFDEGEYAMIKSIMHDRGVFDDARRADKDWLDEQYEKIKTELKSSPKQSHPD